METGRAQDLAWDRCGFWWFRGELLSGEEVQSAVAVNSLGFWENGDIDPMGDVTVVLVPQMSFPARVQQASIAWSEYGIRIVLPYFLVKSSWAFNCDSEHLGEFFFRLVSDG